MAMTGDLVAGAEEQFLRRLVQVLDTHYARLHEALATSWADVDMRRFADSAQVLKLPAQSENAVRIEAILAYGACAAGQALMIELGGGDGHRFVVPPNPVGGPGPAFFAQAGFNIRLENTEDMVASIVTMTNTGQPGARGSGTAGFLYLALMGKEIPPGAVRW